METKNFEEDNGLGLLELITTKQKIALVLFLVAKVSSIAAVPLIFVSMQYGGFLSLAKFLVGFALFLLIGCIVFSAVGCNKEPRDDLDELLENKETRSIILQKLKNLETKERSETNV